MIHGPYGAQRVEDPLYWGLHSAHMQLPGHLRPAVAEGVSPELALSQGIPYPYSYPAVDTVESRTTVLPPAVTIRGYAAAGDAAPPAVGMRAKWCEGPKSST